VAKRREGVACRVMIDDFGSRGFLEGPGAVLLAAGCEVKRFRPLPEGAKLERNHRKLVVVDGRVAITGGFGIRDNWLGDGVHDGSWRDVGVLVEGPAVRGATQIFAENWLEGGGALLPPALFPPIAPVGPSRAAFVSSTASPVLTRAERLTELLFLAAKQRIWIQNAYFVPSRTLLTLLETKAAAGVDVRLLVAGKKSDSKTSFGAQQGLYGSLLKQGARIYEYEPSMMHAKTMIVDDRLTLVGSMNLDPLSLGTLEEIGAIVDDAAANEALAARFVTDCGRATEKGK
jgi:cardiolipin synthase